MIRPSLLRIAEKCGHARYLHETYPAGNEASTGGTAWHKELENHLKGIADSPSIAAILATLPEFVRIESEVPITLRDPETGEVITKGTADFVGHRKSGSVMVADGKSGLPHKIDDPDTDAQLLDYLAGYMQEHNIETGKSCVFFRDYPPARISETLFKRDELIAQMVARHRAAAALSPDIAITGTHCDRCYRRTHCREWMLPVGSGQALEYFAPSEGKININEKNAPQALRVCLAMKDAVKVAEEALKEYARNSGGIEADGKVWAPVPCRGRRSVSIDSLVRVGMLDAVEKAGGISEAMPYERFAWSTATKRKRAK